MASSRYSSIWKRLSDNVVLITDDDSVYGYLRCVICGNILVDATLNTSCGCQYCFRCVSEQIVNNEPQCPGGQEECREQDMVFGKNVVRSELLNREISRLKVNCSNRSCGYNIELGKIDDHLSICKKQPIKCPYSPIGCNCEEISNETLAPHLHSNMLPHTELLIEIIQNLKNELHELREDYGNSKLTIASLSVSSLEKDRKIATIEEEMRNETETNLVRNTILKEQLRNQQRQIEEAKNERDAMKNEYRSYQTEIKSNKEELVIEKEKIIMLETQWKNFQSDITNDSTSIKKLLDQQKTENGIIRNEQEKKNDEIENLLKEISSLNEGLSKNEREMTILKEEVRELRNIFEIKHFTEMDNKVDLDQQLKDTKRNARTMPRIPIEKKDSILNDIRKRSASYHNTSGENISVDFVWQIDQFSTKLNQQMYSTGFYSNNYKLCLYMFINSGSDSICLYCYIMKGRHDEELDWPMRRCLTLSIGDLRSRKVFRSDTYKAEFKKPINDRDEHVGSRLFAKFSSIRDEASVVMNDSITASCNMR